MHSKESKHEATEAAVNSKPEGAWRARERGAEKCAGGPLAWLSVVPAEWSRRRARRTSGRAEDGHHRGRDREQRGISKLGARRGCELRSEGAEVGGGHLRTPNGHGRTTAGRTVQCGAMFNPEAVSPTTEPAAPIAECGERGEIQSDILTSESVAKNRFRTAPSLDLVAGAIPSRLSASRRSLRVARQASLTLQLCAERTAAATEPSAR